MTCRRAIFLSAVAFAVIGTAYAEKVDVPDDALVVRIGASMIVEFTVVGDQLARPRVLDFPAGPNPIVVFDLSENGRSATLSVSHGYAKTLRFRAVARMRGRKRQFELPVNPVPPGVQKSWTMSDPFHELALFEFRLSDAP
jgi:hypothetical protein